MTKGWMIFTQALMVLSLLVWGAAALMSVMAFDSGVTTSALVFVGVILFYRKGA